MPDTDDLAGGLDQLIDGLISPEEPETGELETGEPEPEELAPEQPVAVDDGRKALEARARTLGVPFRSNISSTTLLARIEEAERDQIPLPLGLPPAEQAPLELAPWAEPAVVPSAELSPQTLLEMRAGRAHLEQFRQR